jgi:hypothetical protein
MHNLASRPRGIASSSARIAASLLSLLPTTALLAAEPRAGKPAAEVTFQKNILPFLKAHCFHCHGKTDAKNEADLNLVKYQDDLSIQQDRKVWDNVLFMLRSGDMPPPERPKPLPADVHEVIKAIETVMANLDCEKHTNVGRVTVRRLNRAEYNNTIRDLVGVDAKPAADFPDDDVGYGFDNIGDVLSTTPLLFEKYLAAAEAIAERAIVIVEPTVPKVTMLNELDELTEGERRRRGAVLFGRGTAADDTYAEESGEYIVRVYLAAHQVGNEPVKATVRVGRAASQTIDVTSKDRFDTQVVEIKTRLNTGNYRVSVTFENPFTSETVTDPEYNRRLLYVRNITLDGPYNPPRLELPESHKRIMAHQPGLAPREAAREIIGRFATRAFRRPVKAAEVDDVMKIYDLAEKEGERFENRIRLALCRVLVSPHFLFRAEVDPPGAKAGDAYPISELELASRLSYFLWSTMPDQELNDLALRGELRKNIDSQIQRMLNDPKSSALVQNFAGQWLTLRKLETVDPDSKLFPRFDDDLKAAMQRETELFFEAILREDRSIMDLLDADFTFMNARLARHYGIDGIYGAHFRRVPAPANRGGILTQASILTLTSNPNRTAPVKRGKWILEQLLGTPPPPPPPDVPVLDEEKAVAGNLRQVLEIHRSNAICASCHARMDPLGFGFENFDAIGKWRTKDGEYDIDPSGELPDGRKFQGPAELKTILKSQKELFGRSLAEKMLTYALGRGLEYYDKCSLDKIVAALEKNDYRFSTLIVETIHSDPFQMRTATGEK